MKNIVIKYDWWKAELEIDEDILTKEKAFEILEGVYSIKDDADITGFFLQLVAKEILYFASQQEGSTPEFCNSMVIEEFSRFNDLGHIDGSNGIKLLHCDVWSFNKRGIIIETTTTE